MANNKKPALEFDSKMSKYAHHLAHDIFKLKAKAVSFEYHEKPLYKDDAQRIAHFHKRTAYINSFEHSEYATLQDYLQIDPIVFPPAYRFDDELDIDFVLDALKKYIHELGIKLCFYNGIDCCIAFQYEKHLGLLKELVVIVDAFPDDPKLNVGDDQLKLRLKNERKHCCVYGVDCFCGPMINENYEGTELEFEEYWDKRWEEEDE